MTMIGSRTLPPVPLAPPELVAAFAKTSTAVLSDNLARLPGCVGLLPFHSFTGTMAGTALTVRVASGDNWAIHKALDLIRPGDVLVVDGGGSVERALVGEIMTTLAAQRGAAGVVIDGALRDVGVIKRGIFPCFARTAIHRGPYKNGPGEINVPVSVGGMVIEPGDIVVGDEDGVLAFPPSVASELLAAARLQETREAQIIASILAGTYVDAYAK